MNGLALIPPSQIPDPKKDQVSLSQVIQESRLSSHISKAWERNKNAKREGIEKEMLKDLRAKKGIYEARDLSMIREQGGSEIYMMLTNGKIRGLKSWLRDIIMPAGDKAWETDPTPVPDLPGWAEQEIARRIQETMAPDDSQNEILERVGKLRDLVLVGLREDAKKRGERMEQVIHDQLTEGGWEEALDQFLDDFATFPAAIIKGPVKFKRKKLSWGQMDNGTVIPVTEEVIKVETKRVSPLDCYPSPNAETPNDGDFIEHIRLSRRELRSMRDVEGYSSKEIDAVLDQYGEHGLTEWLWTDYERKELEGKDHWWMQNDGDIDGLHYWGSVQGKLLIEWGKSKLTIDPLAEYEIDAIKIGTHVIRCVINKDALGRRPYHKACLDPIPGSFWGNSLRYLMRDIQRMCNATARAIANNVGMASGPMGEVHVDRLHPDESPDIYPWKMFQTIRGESQSGNSQNIHFFQPNLYAHELLRVYEEFERRADDATGIPRYVTGNDRMQGAGKTSSGLAMLMNSAARGVKAAVGQIDLYVTRPVVEQFYYYNMVNHPDPMIKGDLCVVARGATALLVKEQAHNDRLEFLQLTANPIDMQIIGIEGRAKMLREHSKVLDMPNLIPDDDEFRAKMAQEQSQQQEQPNPDMLKIQVEQSRLALEEKKLQIQEAEGQRKMELEREKLQMEKLIEEQRLQMDKLLQRQKLNSDEDIARERMEYEQRIQIRLEHMRQQSNERKSSVETEKAFNGRNQDIENILKAIESIRVEIDEKEPAQLKTQALPAPQPTEIHVHLDGKGNVTKKITVDSRDKNGQVSALTSKEESINE